MNVSELKFVSGGVLADCDECRAHYGIADDCETCGGSGEYECPKCLGVGCEFCEGNGLAECDDCNQGDNQEIEDFRRAIDGGTQSNEITFSHGDCEACDSGLSGKRYIVHGRDEHGAIIHAEVCEDCYLALVS